MNAKSQDGQRTLLLAYAEASRDLALPLARALEAAGFAVIHAPSRQTPDDAALSGASLVVVCWTPAAVASDAVTLQAARARKAGKLASLLLAPCAPPDSLGGRFMLADLSSWRGDASDKEFVELVHAIHARQSRSLFGAPFWRSRYLSAGGIGAAALGAVALIANFGDLRQAIDGVVNPGASEAALNATDAKVEEVLQLLKQKSTAPLSPVAEAALRESIEQLLSAQSGARGAAAQKLELGDIPGALADLGAAAQEGERATAGLAETWKSIGALHYGTDTFRAIDAYRRASQLAPKDTVARNQLGNLLMRAGHLDEARQVFEDLIIDANDDDETAMAYGNLGVVAMTQEDYETARSSFEVSLDINQKRGNRAGEASDLADLGEIARQEGRLSQAETYFARARDIYVDVGFSEGEAIATSRLGDVAFNRKQYDAAEKHYTRALELAQSTQDSEGIAMAYSGLGGVSLARDALQGAKANYLSSLEAAVRISAREAQAVALEGLGEVASRQHDRMTAIERFRDAMFIYRDMGIDSGVQDMTARMKALGATPAPEGPEN